MSDKKFLYMLIGAVIAIGGLWAVGEIYYPQVNPEGQAYRSLLNPEVDPILKRACFNCHSHETDYPWYASLPGINIFVGSHILEGRRHLNFSLWDQVEWQKQKHLMYEALEEIEERAMPLPAYRLLHPEATLKSEEVEQLKEAVKSKYGKDKRTGHDDHDDHD